MVHDDHEKRLHCREAPTELPWASLPEDPSALSQGARQYLEAESSLAHMAPGPPSFIISPPSLSLPPPRGILSITRLRIFPLPQPFSHIYYLCLSLPRVPLRPKLLKLQSQELTLLDLRVSAESFPPRGNKYKGHRWQRERGGKVETPGAKNTLHPTTCYRVVRSRLG